MTYRYKTEEFLSAIREMVANDQLDEAISEFYSAIPRRDALSADVEYPNIKGQLSEYRRRERLNIGAELVHLNKIRDSFTQLLAEFRRKYPRSAPLKKTPFLIRLGLQPINEKSPNKKYQNKPSIGNRRPLFDLRGIALIVFIIAFAGFVGMNSLIRNINSNRIQLPEGPCWVVYLKTFNDLGDAHKDAKVYVKRRISTLQLPNVEGFVNVLIPDALYSSSASKSLLTPTVAKTWPEAKVIDLKEFCSGTKLKRDKVKKLWTCR